MLKSVPGCIEGIPGHYGMFGGIMGCSRGVPGLCQAVPGCSGLFRWCSGGVPGVFRGVPGCSGCVPGFTDTLNNLPDVSNKPITIPYLEQGYRWNITKFNLKVES